MFEGSGVDGGMFGPDPAFVVAKDHVHHPVQAVFDGPVIADHRAAALRREGCGGEIEACFALSLAGDPARAFDHHDAFQTGPVMAGLQPVHVVEDGVLAGLDAAVIGVAGFVAC